MKRSIHYLALSLFVFLIQFSTGCGLVKNADDALICNLANNLLVAGQEVGVTDTTIGSSDIAQSFTPSVDMKINFVDLTLIAAGTPPQSATLTLSIQKDANGVPDNFSLATPATYPATLVTNGQYKSYRFSFGTLQLTANQKYWLRLHADYPPSNTNIVKWAGSNQNPYSRGEAKYFTNNTWSNTAIGSFSGASHDLVFNLSCNQ